MSHHNSGTKWHQKTNYVERLTCVRQELEVARHQGLELVAVAKHLGP
jgi:hypothetical protein